MNSVFTLLSNDRALAACCRGPIGHTSAIFVLDNRIGEFPSVAKYRLEIAEMANPLLARPLRDFAFVE